MVTNLKLAVEKRNLREMANEVAKYSTPLTLRDVIPMEWLTRLFPNNKTLARLYLEREAERETTIKPIPAWMRSPVGVNPDDSEKVLGGYWATPDVETHKGQRRAVEAIQKSVDSGLYFVGKARVGKTHFLAWQYRCGIANQFTKGTYCHDWFFSDNLWSQKVIDAQFDDSKIALTEQLVEEDAVERGVYHHVYFADFGVRRMTDAHRDNLGGLIDSLYNHHGRLSIATQLNPDQMLAMMGDRIAGRIMEMCTRIEVF